MRNKTLNSKSKKKNTNNSERKTGISKKFYNKEKILYYIFSAIMFILIFLFLLSKIIKNSPNDLDELWNYNTARCFLNGLIPYKEISMITTPLFPKIVSLFLKIFGDNLFIFRCVNALLFTCILLVVYKIFNKLQKNKIISLLFTLLITFIYCEKIYLDYNFFVLFIALLIEYIELKTHIKKINISGAINKIEKTNIKQDVNKNNIKQIKNDSKFKKFIKKYKYDIIIGFLCGIAIMSKQTLGVVVSFFALLAELLFVKNKKELKEFIKKDLVRLFFILIISLIFLIYLITTSSFSDFISYGVLGIKTFSNKITYIQFLMNLLNVNSETNFRNVILSISSIALPMIVFITLVFLISTHKKLKNKEEKNIKVATKLDEINKENTRNKILILSFWALPMMIAIYPIADQVHFLVGFLQTFILTFYIIYLLFSYVYNNKKMKNINVFIYAVLISFIMLVLIYEMITNTISNFKEYNKSTFENKTLKQYKEYISQEEYPKHFEYIPLSNELINRINNIREFYYGKKENSDINDIYMLDAMACVFDIPMDKYYKNYDMFLKGNLGKDGEDGIIKDIENSKNTLYLVRKSDISNNWQAPEKVLDYVRNNLEYQGRIDIFDIYYKK